MKNHKLFQICYTINFIICLWVLAIAFYRINTDIKEDVPYIFIFALGIIFSILTFDWFCYRLLQTVKNTGLLSRKFKIAGLIFNMIGCLVCLLCIALLTNILLESISGQQKLNSINAAIFTFPLFGLTVTLSYSCITYWQLRKQLNKNFANSIETLGSEN